MTDGDQSIDIDDELTVIELTVSRVTLTAVTAANPQHLSNQHYTAAAVDWSN